MTQRKHILFICTGNTCRSPMAEGLFRKLSAHHPEWQAGSAGTAAWPGQAASPETLHVLREHGVNLSSHESRPGTDELMKNATDVYAMTESHLAALLANFPEHADKVRLVTCYTDNRDCGPHRSRSGRLQQRGAAVDSRHPGHHRPDGTASVTTLSTPMAAPSIRIDLSRQELVLEKSGKILLQCPVSSGKAGTGHEEGSGKTPTGHFRICKKIGDGEPEDTIFISRLPAGRYPTAIPKSLNEHSDFILTRILWLDGLEPHNANTRSRYIYIHGTNDTELLGTPASHGCIRLSPRDMMALFALAEEGMDVFIQC
ncbi:MAG: L,D-transpeptidase family protein [Akkermansia sp.]